MGPSPRPLGLYGLLCTSLVEMNGFGPTSLGVWIHSFLCFSRHVVWKGERPWLRQVCLWPLVEVEPRAPSQCANTWRPKLPSVYAAPSIRHVEVATGIQHVGIAAWQSCQQLQIVKLPISVVSLAEGTFRGCYVLRQVAAPGCVHYGQRVFAECCSLGSVGVKCDSEDSSVLAPGAQLGRYAFESCLTLATVTFNTDRTHKPRALPEGAFCGAGIEQLCLPHDFHNIGPRACENCKSLVEVNLMSTEITALLSSTFAHCVALQCIWLPPRLIQIGKEAFLNCVVLQEVVIPTELSEIGNRAFCGCEQLQRFTLLDWGDVEQWAQAEHNAFFMCDKFEKPHWLELLPAEGPDSDAFDEELSHEYCHYHASPG